LARNYVGLPGFALGFEAAILLSNLGEHGGNPVQVRHAM